jgi:hypothetical protein
MLASIVFEPSGQQHGRFMSVAESHGASLDVVTIARIVPRHGGVRLAGRLRAGDGFRGEGPDVPALVDGNPGAAARRPGRRAVNHHEGGAAFELTPPPRD